MLTTQRIENQNQINALANGLELEVIEMLKPWLGKKVRKISGDCCNVAKLDKELKAFLERRGFNQPSESISVCLVGNYHSLQLHIRDRKSALVVDCYVGRFSSDEGILTELADPEPRRSDYTLEEVEGALSQARKLEEQARQLQNSVRVFTR